MESAGEDQPTGEGSFLSEEVIACMWKLVQFSRRVTTCIESNVERVRSVAPLANTEGS